MRQPVITITRPPPRPGRLLPGDQVVSAAEIRELGLEEAPADIGLSVEEVEDLERRRSPDHG